jgi:hypothetical protein
MTKTNGIQVYATTKTARLLKSKLPPTLLRLKVGPTLLHILMMTNDTTKTARLLKSKLPPTLLLRLKVGLTLLHRSMTQLHPMPGVEINCHLMGA